MPMLDGIVRLASQGDIIWTGPKQMTTSPAMVLPKTKGEFISLVRSHSPSIGKAYTKATLKRDVRDPLALFVAERKGNQWVVTEAPGESSTIVLTDPGMHPLSITVDRGADMGFRQFLDILEKKAPGSGYSKAELFVPGDARSRLEATRFNLNEGWILGNAEDLLVRTMKLLGYQWTGRSPMVLVDDLDLFGLPLREIAESLIKYRKQRSP